MPMEIEGMEKKKLFLELLLYLILFIAGVVMMAFQPKEETAITPTASPTPTATWGVVTDDMRDDVP